MDYELRAPIISDIEALNKIRTDDRIYKNILSLTSESIEETKSYFFDNNLYKENLIIKVGGSVIGYVQLRRNTEKRKFHKASLSIALSYEYHHKYYGTIMMDRMIDIAKNQLGLKKLELTVLENNKHAIEFYKKSGFVVEGLQTFDTIVDGEYENVYILGMIL